MNFIQKRGRISRSDLVLECNRLIKMNPTEEVIAYIEAEETNCCRIKKNLKRKNLIYYNNWKVILRLLRNKPLNFVFI